MQELVDVFSNNKVLILGIVLFIFVLILLGYLLTAIIVNKKRRKKEIIKIEKIDKEEVEEIEIQEQEQIKDQEKITNELEEMLDKMQKTLDEKEEIDSIANFEREQEENAIISYQELLKAAKRDFPQMNLTDKTEMVEIKEDRVDKIEILKEIDLSEEPEIDINIEENETLEIDQEQNDEKKFKNSIFISPIGITGNENPNYYKEVKIRKDYLKEMADSRFNTVDIQTEDLEYEKEENEQFLEDLKSFRDNL